MDGDVPVQFLVLKTGYIYEFLKDRFCCSVSNSNSLRTKLRFESNYTVFIIVEYAAESLMFPQVYLQVIVQPTSRGQQCVLMVIAEEETRYIFLFAVSELQYRFDTEFDTYSRTINPETSFLKVLH